MAVLLNFDESNTHTLQSIDELYNTHYNIRRVYHFQYKSDESAVNFGNLAQSLLDKTSHHTIYDVESCYVTEDKKNLILTPTKNTAGTHTIAYSLIPDNYRFDIISSLLDGKTLVIYDKHIKSVDTTNVVKTANADQPIYKGDKNIFPSINI